MHGRTVHTRSVPSRQHTKPMTRGILDRWQSAQQWRDRQAGALHRRPRKGGGGREGDQNRVLSSTDATAMRICLELDRCPQLSSKDASTGWEKRAGTCRAWLVCVPCALVVWWAISSRIAAAAALPEPWTTARARSLARGSGSGPSSSCPVVFCGRPRGDVVHWYVLSSMDRLLDEDDERSR